MRCIAFRGETCLPACFCKRTGLYFIGICSAVLLLLLISSCTGKDTKETGNKATTPDSLKLFQLLDTSETGISFANNIVEDQSMNPIVYEYTYNGGGVAIGDVNNDGLDDIFFTANQQSNRLYLNKGGLKFEDISVSSGTGGKPGCWKTGVTMADVNGDGLLDIYVCYSGDLPGNKRINELLINQGINNNGIPHFQDQAVQWNLADSSYSTQASFFDYDKDGDLDMVLINHTPHVFNNLDEANLNYLRNLKNQQTGVRLFRNTGNKFEDVTGESGILNTSLSFGLGVSVSDINNDNWPDIYISNDYMAADYLYINNRNGTFTDRTGETLNYTSQFSMGNDIADFNNDGWNDIYTLDMVPEDNHRQKLLSSIDNYEFFELRNKVGLHPQFMRNMLHLNNGNNSFSEIGQASGISNTDWSWSPLFADFDNDGWKDLFVANGFVHDYTNLDFLKFMGDFLRQTNYDLRNQNLLEIAAKAPSSNVVNYIFRNNGDLTFKNMAGAWGMDKPSNSNGAAYADLDNDGDLDLVINNTNQPSFIFRNEANRLGNKNYLRIKLKGEKKNTLGVGARIFAYSKGSVQTAEQLITRGYQSSVSPVLHIGLGEVKKLDSLRVIWPSGKMELLKDIVANSTLDLDESRATQVFRYMPLKPRTIFHSTNRINYTHKEDPVNDFKRQPLLTASLSYSGPCMAKGDVNGDGLEDLFMGGASGQAGVLFLQNKNRNFTASIQAVFNQDAYSEDTDACFADIDNDGDLDLYVCSGGYDRFSPDDPALQDRLYLNDGRGKFTKSTDALPGMLVSKSCVTAADINGDGSLDFFVGGRVIPGRYPETPQSFLLLNDGKGHFKSQPGNANDSLCHYGMVTTAVFSDMNLDGQPDLVIAGEFMPIMIWINNKGAFTDKTQEYFDKAVPGCWNKIMVEDVNNDKRPDIIAGNMGLNSQIKCSPTEPAELYYKDFDDNGSIDPVLCYYIQGKSYPAISRDELLDQMSIMRARFPDYKSYADATINQIFSEAELHDARHLKATSFSSAVFVYGTSGKYRQINLPFTAQQSPVYAFGIADMDGDGIKDIITGGNVSHARLRFGFCEANHGTLLKGTGDGSFIAVPQLTSGLKMGGDVRSITIFGHTVLFGVNNASVVSFEY